MPGLPFIDPPPAFVHGYAARALAIWLRRGWDRGDFATLPADGRETVAATIRAIEYAGEAWYRRRVSAVGNYNAGGAEITSELVHEVSTGVAAGMLNVTERRVRQLAAAGMGRKVGSVWLVDPELLAAEMERRSA